MNLVVLIGNLGADPEVRSANSGTSVCNLRLATSSREKVNGEWQNVPEWHRVVCFGNTADAVAKFTRKGSKVAVRGSIKTNKWTDKDGTVKYSTEIVASEVNFLDPKGANADGGGGGRSSSGGGGGYSGGGNTSGGGYDEDIPF